MDNLTHSLTGLMLSRAGLNRLYPRATMLLILSANAPDIDIVAIARGRCSISSSIAAITHSIAALPVMALLCVLLVCAFSRNHARMDGGLGTRHDRSGEPSVAGLDQYLRHSVVPPFFGSHGFIWT